MLVYEKEEDVKITILDAIKIGEIAFSLVKLNKDEIEQFFVFKSTEQKLFYFEPEYDLADLKQAREYFEKIITEVIYNA